MMRQPIAALGLVALCSLVVAGCAQVGDGAQQGSVATIEVPAPVELPAGDTAAPPELAAHAAQEEVATVGTPAIAADATTGAPLSEPAASAPATSPAATGALSADGLEPLSLPLTQAVESVTEVAVALAHPASATRAAIDTLDFKALASRLRKTKAINLSTKLSVKNLSDDLLADFRAYHDQRGTVSLGELRRSYDSLFQRLHSLLHDADPLLDRDIDRSRAALWEILADPRTFSASQSSQPLLVP
jgi:hypothetical protein